MRKMATESIFTVTHVIVNARVETSVNVSLLTVPFIALVDCKILIRTEVLSHLQLTFKFFILKKLLVVHIC